MIFLNIKIDLVGWKEVGWLKYIGEGVFFMVMYGVV